MRERPILFKGPMVRAILAGNKTQTRRVVKPQPPSSTVSVHLYHHPDPRPHFWAADGGSLLDWAQPCPYGAPGERLWVRETWQHANHPFGPYQEGAPVFYRADYHDDPHGPDGELSPQGKYRGWRPSIYMPRAACRLALEVTGVRVERLSAISETDAQAEGCDPWEDLAGVQDVTVRERLHGYKRAYQHLWEQLHGADSWRANPWVWVIEFRVLASANNETGGGNGHDA
ncbi:MULTISPECIES: hypothetical protein [Achromobacter]|uniref:hypothetical protein n=1 Tax=Achromobacter TaxID=222 RepID=UPI001EEC4EC2|nr:MULTISPECIES: hypothetical protein [Achromobacter]MCH4572516.1 hypothetical protein [Achromobacter xylosoxidans]